MAKDTDELFVQIALEKGLLTEEQVREVREAAEILEKIGMPSAFSVRASPAQRRRQKDRSL